MTDPGKKERLAAALRENLRKRKTQARAVAQSPAPAASQDRQPDNSLQEFPKDSA